MTKTERTKRFKESIAAALAAPPEPEPAPEPEPEPVSLEHIQSLAKKAMASQKRAERDRRVLTAAAQALLRPFTHAPATEDDQATRWEIDLHLAVLSILAEVINEARADLVLPKGRSVGDDDVPGPERPVGMLQDGSQHSYRAFLDLGVLAAGSSLERGHAGRVCRDHMGLTRPWFTSQVEDRFPGFLATVGGEYRHKTGQRGVNSVHYLKGERRRQALRQARGQGESDDRSSGAEADD